MASKIFKRIIPMILGGLAILVFAMPMTASARDWDHHDWGHRGWGHRDWDHDWDHHDHGRHVGWYRHDRDDDDCGFRPGYGYYPQNYYGFRPGYGYYRQHYYAPQAYPYAPQAYPRFRQPFGYGYGSSPRRNYLQQQWSKAEARHQNALATGNRRAARISSQRLYQLDRRMGATGYGR